MEKSILMQKLGMQEDVDPGAVFDLHIHSSFSSDGKASPLEIVDRAIELGFGGVAVVDHNSPKGGIVALGHSSHGGLIVIPGVEVSSSSGHILAFGVKDPVPRGLSPSETVERIETLGGIAVAPHPYRFWSGLGEENTRQAGFKILEAVNARSNRKHNNLARKLANDIGFGSTGGSDAHDTEHIGMAATIFPHAPSSMDDALQMLSSGKTTAVGANRGAGDTIRYVKKSVSEWLSRGMRRM